MNLEQILKPLKYADEKIARNYAKFNKKLNLEEGRRKYLVGTALTLFSTWDFALAGTNLFSNFEGSCFFSIGSNLIINYYDFNYNWNGLRGNIKEVYNNNKISLNQVVERSRKYNSIIRLPVFLAGVGFMGKFGFDLFNHFSNGAQIDAFNYSLFRCGFGLLEAASSMYIKDSGPKLLEKQPFWKDSLDFAKSGYEKIKNTIPSPRPSFG